MNENIALIVRQLGVFEVCKLDNHGGSYHIASSPNLEDCLNMAAQNLGHPIVIPISGPNTTL